MFDKLEVNGIKVKKVLHFGATTGFGKWKKYFPKESVAHPAKANLKLLEYLILSYTKEGDTLCDPMSGSGSTGVIAALNGRNCIQVELEEKFYKWMEQARENVEKTPQLTKKGKIINILGNSRNLSELLKEHEEEISHVLFSPPYGEAHQSKNLGLADGNRKDLRLYSWLKTNNPAQIDNLPFHLDCIVTSPPFGPAQRGGGIAQKGYEGRYGKDKRLHLRHDRPLSENEANISNLSIDHVIFSPPYSLGHDSGDNASEDYKERLEEQRKHTRAYSIGNIAKLPFIGAILFSPPYEGSMGDKHHSPKGDKLVEEKRHFNTYTDGKDKNNIGNLKKETYLEAMRKVYAECYKVLKPQGKMIIIIKDFIRNFQVVKLHEHTRQLCESCGFKLKEVLMFKIPQRSFWRILYKKKYGHKVKDLDMLDYEWILIFERG